MRNRIVAIVLALGCVVSLAGLEGCAAKKQLPPPQVEAPAPAPVVEPEPEPVTPEPPAKVEVPTPPSDLAFTTIYFDFDKSNVRDDQVGPLNGNGDLLNLWKTIGVRVEGNCDERGSNEYNLALGQRRADSVKQFLVNYGISDSRIATVSYGEERPAVSGHSEDAWAQNRRAEFIITDR